MTTLLFIESSHVVSSKSNLDPFWVSLQCDMWKMQVSGSEESGRWNESGGECVALVMKLSGHTFFYFSKRCVSGELSFNTAICHPLLIIKPQIKSDLAWPDTELITLPSVWRKSCKIVRITKLWKSQRQPFIGCEFEMTTPGKDLCGYFNVHVETNSPYGI